MAYNTFQRILDEILIIFLIFCFCFVHLAVDRLSLEISIACREIYCFASLEFFYCRHAFHIHIALVCK